MLFPPGVDFSPYCPAAAALSAEDLRERRQKSRRKAARRMRDMLPITMPAMAPAERGCFFSVLAAGGGGVEEGRKAMLEGKGDSSGKGSPGLSM